MTSTTIGSSKVTKVVLGNTGKIIGVGLGNGALAVYGLAEDSLLAQDLKYHNMPITAVAFSADDSLCYTAAHERTLHSWDLTKMKHLDAFDSIHRFAVNCIEPCDGGFYTAGHEGSLKRWTVSN